MPQDPPGIPSTYDPKPSSRAYPAKVDLWVMFGIRGGVGDRCPGLGSQAAQALSLLSKESPGLIVCSQFYLEAT